MNTALKHWREAATVILAAGMRRTQSVDSLRAGVDTFTAPTQTDLPDKAAFDYRVLLLKRSGKSGFMPNAYVFPGGLVDSSDFSSEWQEIFKSFTKAPNYGIGVVRQPPATRPPIFATDRAKLGSPLPGDVAFRICAVRETFEESGVLLVVPKHEENTIHVHTTDENDWDTQPTLTRLSGAWDEHVLSRWRSLVIDNSANFIKMCKELQCLPNIWALREWGNWLTPTGVYDKHRRYDTAFYICCLLDTPHTLEDEKEIVHFKWSTPSEVLHSYKSREIWIAPPQFYDLGRTCRFPALRDLHSFACKRSLEGCEQWLPIRLLCTDGYISLLPGDAQYPENVDFSGKSGSTVRSEKSLEDLQRDSSNLHRIVFQDPYTTSVHMNITPKYNHVPPLCSAAVDGQSKNTSKL
ncbi:nucleoside diphosphate-linked moiety X motif 19 [Myxocyprinus asiaticus]|uniref:nucleoside diphosphate-linked moiety X motif 19 n=1 Tax=Myxocyprinus asiaticus TaxID=70543 RepID=UPI002222551F|nr:nucleoside diphosphate-linked moiety X motif 19 [Myxocyprinus asiaticus]